MLALRAHTKKEIPFSHFSTEFGYGIKVFSSRRGCTFSPPKQTDRLAREYICNMSFFENKRRMKTGA